MPPIPPKGTTPYGSIDVAIDRGIAEGSKVIAGWVKQLLDAVDGVTQGGEIQRAINTAAMQIDARPLQDSIERQDIRSKMLGAADADWEALAIDVVTRSKIKGTRRPVIRCKVPDIVQKSFGSSVGDFIAKHIIPRTAFDSMVAESKRRASTIASAVRIAVISAVHDEIKLAMAVGSDLSKLAPMLKESMTTRGFLKPSAGAVEKGKAALPWYVELVYVSAIVSGYAKGRKVQMTEPAVIASRPYWQIVTMMADGRSRATHAAAHGKILRHDDPFWERAGPPFGFRCRCKTISRSAADVSRLGLEVTDGSTMTDLPDPGWSTM